MARLKAAEADYKKSQGRELYSKGFSITNISEIIGIGVKTLSKWREEEDWDEEKELQTLKPTSIRRLTLKCALAIEKGEPMPYKADDIAKIVAAFDRITDSKKIAVYTMESIDNFCAFMLEKAGKATGKKRDELLNQIKAVRPYFDEYITQLLSDD
ncbi:terminase gpP N-terminus-related DNA-binding protein [Riemerella columbipharyngis]|uniref:Putative ATPase subunit of terminase (GpP-like) n=1 Tax=Riemerella columbipharyngis TaxID=1071918 RepID=A0A1G7FLP4_9FLAO|nr:hypothetical protein [Riemerella columbipharyngis]SDE76822.1 Putative ATPase subunit of terminase (gpP-like) [Riemerella columbipharyngis]